MPTRHAELTTMSRLLLLAGVLFASAARAQGQCYYSANKLADSHYVPCSDGSGDSSCCLAGDYCLDGAACYSQGTGITYIAGCTDPNYEDQTCGAQSCQKNTQFQALAICDDTNWVCCTGQGQVGTIPGNPHSPNCPCDLGYSTAIQGASSLSATTSLPTALPSVSTPSSSAAASTTPIPSLSSGTASLASPSSTSSSSGTPSTSSTGGTTLSPSASASQSVPTNINLSINTNAPTATGNSANNGSSSGPTPVPAPSNNSSRNIGIGVGVGVGVPLVAALAGLLYFFLRRRSSREPAPQHDTSTTTYLGDVTEPRAGGPAGGASNAAAPAAAAQPPMATANKTPATWGTPSTADAHPSPPPQYRVVNA